MTDATEALLDELEHGLEGVTPGPWSRQPADPDGTIFIIADNLGGLVGAACPWPTEAESGGSKRIEANAAHIARCYPENIRTLISLARQAKKLEAERDEAERKP